MKKILLILSMIALLFLVGCNSSKEVNNNLTENNNNQQIVDNTATQLPTKSAKEILLTTLKDSNWIKENVTMKQTCFGEPFTIEQELTFEKLSDDLAIVQAYAYEADNNFGVQVFLAGYQDGEIKVVSLPEDIPTHPGHGGYALDKENQILLSVWAHQGALSSTYYKISNTSFEELESINYANESEFDEEAFNVFEAKYNTLPIENKLTSTELDRIFNENT